MTMQKRAFRLTVMSVVAMAVIAFHSSAARASFITFQNGAGGVQAPINSVSMADANTLTVGGANLAPGADVNTYYQGQVAALKNGSNFEFTTSPNALNHNFFLTLMFGATERVTSLGANSNGTTTGTLTLSPSATVNYFALYAQSTHTANDHTGTGFNSGTQILTGLITNLASTFTSNNGINPNTGLPQPQQNVAFDTSGGPHDSHAPTSGKSVGQPPIAPGGPNQPGTGGFSLTVQVTSANANWFPGLPVGSNMVFIIPSGSLIDQFQGVSPSQTFQLGNGSNGNPGSFSSYNPALGNVNGLVAAAGGTGRDFQFQTDASATFQTPAVPEPASFTLLALGGLSFVGTAIRRRLARKVSK